MHAGSSAGRRGHPELHRTDSLLELGELVDRTGSADLESFDLAEPAFLLGLGDAVG